jgi:hypothetical protein
MYLNKRNNGKILNKNKTNFHFLTLKFYAYSFIFFKKIYFGGVTLPLSKLLIYVGNFILLGPGLSYMVITCG